MDEKTRREIKEWLTDVALSVIIGGVFLFVFFAGIWVLARMWRVGP